MQILRAEQAAYDEQYFDLGYENLDEVDEKIRHIGEHLGKITGIKAIHWETGEWETKAMRRVVDEEVIPDLAMYRTQLANVSGVSDEALVSASANFAGGVLKPSKLMVHARLAKARGLLDGYSEPLPHGRPSPMWMPQQSSLHIQEALAGIEYHYGLTPGEVTDMHRQRLVSNAARFDELNRQRAEREWAEVIQDLSTR